MAGDSTVIKEFLVALGVKIDDVALKKFTTHVSQIQKSVEVLALVFTTAAGAIEGLVTNVAEQIEDLYYAAQRSETTTKNLRALQYAASQIGVGADAAGAALAFLADKIRTSQIGDVNPFKGWIEASLGIPKLSKDTTEAFHQILDRIAEMYKTNEAEASRYAQAMLGIDSGTLKLLVENNEKMKAWEVERKAMLDVSGHTQEEIDRRSLEFMKGLRQLGAELETIKDIIMADFEPAALWLIQRFEDLVKFLIQLDKSTAGWSTRIFVAVLAIKTMLVLWSGLVALKAALFGVAAGAEAIGAGGVAAAAGISLLQAAIATLVAAGGAFVIWKAYQELLGKPFQDSIMADVRGDKQAKVKALEDQLERVKKKHEELVKTLSETPGRADEPFWQKLLKSSQQDIDNWTEAVNKAKAAATSIPKTGAQPGAGVYSGLPTPAPSAAPPATGGQNLLPTFRALEGSGDTAVSPKGAVGRYQIMPATARAYGFDPDKLSDPTYNANVAATILADLWQKFKGNIQDIAVAYNAGIGRALKWIAGGRNLADLPGETQRYLAHLARITQAQGATLSADDAMRATSNARLGVGNEIALKPGPGLMGGSTTTIDQKTEITVQGSSDPIETGRAVANEQDRVNANLARNAGGSLH